MWSRPTDSSASADLPPGTQIAGFRVDRVIGRGSRAVVYEAMQLSLNRRVALKVMRDPASADRLRRLSWPDHPGAVSLFGVGDSEHGPWLAMKLVPGSTLAKRRARLDAVVAALDRAHAGGIVHGDVAARNVLVDDAGRAYLSDFGLAESAATPEDDRAALAALVRDRSPRPGRRRGALVGAAAAAIAVVVVAGVLMGIGGGDDDAEREPPPPSAGAQPIGSALAAGGIESVDCDGSTPSGASLACTISPRDLDGRPVAVPADGTITSWAVRGARGTLALQVLRGRGRRLLQVAKSREETVPGPEPSLYRTDLHVVAGDRVALEVSPMSAIGVRRSGPPAANDRWFGPLLEPGRPPERPAGSGLDHEVLLRVDVRPDGPR